MIGGGIGLGFLGLATFARSARLSHKARQAVASGTKPVTIEPDDLAEDLLI